MTLLLRAVLVLAGLVAFASLLLVSLLLLTVWSVRALWARVTGRPVRPFAMRFLRV